ncbi:MAG: ATP-binding protein [Nitrospirae bacterium]|nr:ATP-binding protein [Nitrospirota bacterium]
MARADLLINLVKAGSSGDHALFKKTVEALAAEERAKQHHVLADRLIGNIKSNGSSYQLTTNGIDEKVQNLLFDIQPKISLQDLILPGMVLTECKELIEEHQRRELLHSYNLEPRNRILLAGPPGNGKTSLAEAIAQELMVPFFVVRYEGIIGSYLGETATRLKKLFEYARTRNCVLFFDEFDAIGKERGDVHETGEIKRVVSSLLMQIDTLPSYVVVVTASNHPELLDRAVWRRFQLKMLLPKPSISQVEEWLIRFEKRLKNQLGHSLNVLAKRLEGASFAELEDFCTDILRRNTLSLPDSNIKKIVDERIKQWETRFVLPSKKEKAK